MNLHQNRHFDVCRSRGFTLVELLVALGIVMILLAISMPALKTSRDSARNALCGTSLRQVGYVTALYCDDNEGDYPEFFFSFGPGNSNTIVILTVPKRAAKAGWSYYSGPIRLCPEDPDPALVPVLDDNTGVVTEEEISWGYNIDFLLHRPRDWELPSYTQPSNFAVFWDGSMGKGSAGGDGKKNIQGHYFSSFDFANRSFFLRHFNQRWGNVLFADWHVSSQQFIDEDQTLMNYQPMGLGNGNSGNNGGNGGTTTGPGNGGSGNGSGNGGSGNNNGGGNNN